MYYYFPSNNIALYYFLSSLPLESITLLEIIDRIQQERFLNCYLEETNNMTLLTLSTLKTLLIINV